MGYELVIGFALYFGFVPLAVAALCYFGALRRALIHPLGVVAVCACALVRAAVLYGERADWMDALSTVGWGYALAVLGCLLASLGARSGWWWLRALAVLAWAAFALIISTQAAPCDGCDRVEGNVLGFAFMPNVILQYALCWAIGGWLGGRKVFAR